MSAKYSYSLVASARRFIRISPLQYHVPHFPQIFLVITTPYMQLTSINQANPILQHLRQMILAIRKSDKKPTHKKPMTGCSTLYFPLDASRITKKRTIRSNKTAFFRHQIRGFHCVPIFTTFPTPDFTKGKQIV